MSSQKIEPYEAGYEYAYLTGPLKNQYKTIVDIEATLHKPFKGWLKMDSNWTKGYNQYYKDVNNDLDDGHNAVESHPNYGPKGPLSFIYAEKRSVAKGKKSKRRSSQKKRKTHRSRK